MAQSVTVGNGGNKTTRTMYVGNSGNKRVLQGYIGTGSGNAQFFAGLDAEISPSSADAGFDEIETNTVTAGSVGGKTPFSYLWAYVSGSTTPAAQQSLTGATQHWRVSPLVSGHTAVWRVTITDAHGSVSTEDVDVVFQGPS